MRHTETIDIHNIVVVDARKEPGWSFPLHKHDNHLEISLIQGGSGNFYCDGRSYTMKTGDLIIKNAGMVHAEQASLDQPLLQTCISFSGVSEIEGAPNCLLPDYMEPVLETGEDFPLISAAFTYLANHWQEPGKGVANRYAMLSALEVISGLIAEAPAAPQTRTPNSRTVNTVTEVMAYINEHYAEKITLERLAEQFFISPFYLEKKFKEYTGYSVNRYVISRRMGEAQRMLIFEDMSVKEVAAAVGYENLQYFYASFKKNAGKTPVEFRREYIS